MAPSIPDRWIPYKACGKIIEGTRIVCFKVPLKKIVQLGKIGVKEIWDISTLLSAIPNLRAVIDLTNTNRYYNPEELKSAGVLHKKILMPGRIIPPEDKVKEFMDAVDQFLNMDEKSILGVHCTHGLNRTGYMVCRYMRDRMDVAAKDAIKRFEKARGYQIERENYKEHLLGREPPPPDVGRGVNTTIKPLNRKANRKRKHSTEVSEGRNVEDHERSRYGKWKNRKQNKKRDSFSDTKRSYDFKYDY